MIKGATTWQKFGRSLRASDGVGRNLVAMVIWQGANYLAPLITFPHLARTLHPEGFGLMGIYLVVGGWMTIVSDWGTVFTGSRLIAQDMASTGNIDRSFWNIFALRWMIVIALLVGAIGWLVATHADRGHVLLLLSAWMIIFGNALTVSWCLQGMERLDAFATASLAGRVLTVPATILLVRHADQVWLAVLIQGLGGVVIGLVSLIILLRSRVIRSFSFSWRGCWDQCRDGAPVLLATASHGLYSSTATACLGYVSGTHATGIFVAADRIRLAAQGIAQPVGQALYPRISRQVVTDRAAAVRTIRYQLIGFALILVPVCLGLELSAGLIMRLVAGPAFTVSIPVLRIHAITVGVYALNCVLGWQTLMPFGHTKIFSRGTILAAVVNLVIMPLLVMAGGSVGAAIGVLLTEVVLLLYYSFFVRRLGLLSVRA